MSFQAAATIVALGIAFVLMAAIPAVLIWVFLATMRGEGVMEGDHPSPVAKKPQDAD